MQGSSRNNGKPETKQSQAADFFEAIFSQQGGGFLEIRSFEVHYSAGPCNKQSQQQPFSTKAPSLTGSLLGIKGAPCHAVDG